MSVFTQKIRPKRLLYMQLAFTVLAFLAMVVLSYLFMRNIVHTHLIQNAEGVLSYVQSQIYYDLNESRVNLSAFSRTMRNMILRGDSTLKITEYINDLSEYLLFDTARNPGFSGLLIYLEEPQISSSLEEHGLIRCPQCDINYEVSAENELWYKNAVAANGEIAETLMYTGSNFSETFLVYSICIFDDQGRRLAVVAQQTRIDAIGKKVVETALSQGGYGMLINQDLMIIAHANPALNGQCASDPNLPYSAFVNDMTAGSDITGRSMENWKGEDTLVFLEKLENGWYLGLLTPKGPFYQSVTNMALTLCVLGAILGFALMFVLVRIDAAREKADVKNRQKSAFLANMSHEMRTPLNAVIGLSELILEAEALSDESYMRLEKIYSAGITLLGTVNDILDISKIEAGKFELDPAAYDIPSLINDAVAQSIMYIGEKPIQFKLQIDRNLPQRLCGDEIRIKQILNNLLTNAFKYTEEGTVELGIFCEPADSGIWMNIIVRDTGIGIRPDYIDKLFDDYARADRKANRKIMGTGLGLPITKKLLRMMDGTISVESEYERGSVFTARLKQQSVSDVVIGQEVVDNLQNFNYSEKKRHRNTKLIRPNLSYARVLLVDDVETNLDIAKGLMKPYKMQVDCVLSGQDAIEAVREEKVRYNAIFMDHMMPLMDGIEAARIIREEIGTEYAKNVPIIALTANAIVGNEKLFLDRGFQAFISKPIEILKLDFVIREFVRNKEQEKMFFEQQKKTAEEAPPEMKVRVDWHTLNSEAAGLDIKKGIAFFGGDEASYFDVLRSFADNTPPLLEAAKEVNRDNLAYFAIVVHGIKGSSRGICADKFADMAEMMEKAATAGDYAYVTGSITAFLKTAWNLVSEIDKILFRLCVDNPKPLKKFPDKEVLDRLLAACRNYDMDGVDTSIAEINCYEYKNDDGLALWIRKNVEQMNFSQIIKKLSGIKQ